MAKFRDPRTGNEEFTGIRNVLGTLFFGVVYLAFRGLWLHVAINLVTSIAFGFLFGLPGLYLIAVMWVCYAAATPCLLNSKYKREEWLRISSNATIESQAAVKFVEVNADKIGLCCAGVAKVAGKRCRDCGRESADECQPAINPTTIIVAEASFIASPPELPSSSHGAHHI